MKLTFSKEHVDFINKGLGMTLPYDKEIEFSRETLLEICEYSEDVEIAEASQMVDGIDEDISPYGKIACLVQDFIQFEGERQSLLREEKEMSVK